MRQKRAKAYKKLMALYSMSFGFRQPYQVVVDSTFCLEVCQHKMDPLKQLGTVLQGECKIMITQCSMVELYKLGPSAQHVVDLAKQFERRRCNHREAIENEPCVESVVGPTNKHRYVIATQSTDLRDKLRKIPAVPLVHINRSVMVLEPRSEATMKAKDQSDVAGMSVRQSEARALASTSTPALAEPVHHRKIAKAPNPLSMKKKKSIQAISRNAKEPSETKNSSADSLKRRRGTDGFAGESQVNGSALPEDKGGHPATTGSGHKRKRRRKDAQAGSTS